MVVDRSSGLLVYYPNLFLTTQIRNRGDAFSTMLAAASNLVMLLRFVDSRGINLDQRFLIKDFFKPHELDDLRDFAQRKQGNKPLMAPSSPWLEDATIDIVDNGTQYSRLTTFANYLRWYAMNILKTVELEVAEQINIMATQIKTRRSSKKGRNSDLQGRSLSDVQLNMLFEVILLGSESNPFSKDVQRRNRLMVLLLFYLSIRGGELLNIRIQDVDFCTNKIRIVTRAACEGFGDQIRRVAEKKSIEDIEQKSKESEETVMLNDLTTLLGNWLSIWIIKIIIHGELNSRVAGTKTILVSNL